MISTEQIIEAAKACGLPNLTDYGNECISRLALHFYKQGLLDAAEKIGPTEEHRKDAAWGYLGGTEGVELLDANAEAIRNMAEEVGK